MMQPKTLLENRPYAIRGFLFAFAMVMLGLSVVPSAQAQSAYYNALTSLNPAVYFPLQETNQPPLNDIETNYGSLGASANAIYSGARAIKGAPGITPSATADGDVAVTFLGNTAAGVLPPLSGSFLGVPLTDSRVSVSSPGFTVEAWINAANYNGFVGIVSQAAGNPGGLNGTTNQAGWVLSAQYLPFYDSSNVRGFSFHVYNGQSFNGNGAPRGGAEVVVPIGYALNTWYHLVATFDGTNCSMYINGTNMNSVAYRVPMPGGTSYLRDLWDPLQIGASRNLNGNPFIGLIDEVAVYSNVLTQAQVQNHFNAAAGVNYFSAITNDNPLMYYRMDAPSYTAPDPSTYPTASYFSGSSVVMNVGSGTLSQPVYGTATKPGVPGPQFPGMLDPANGNNSYGVAINGIGGANGGTANINIGNNVIDTCSIPIDAGYNTALDPKAPPFSVSIWFKGDPADANGSQRFQNIVGHTDNGWRFALDTAGKVHFKPGNNGTEITSARVYNDGNWHHLVATCTTTAEVLYVDGVQDSTAGSAATFTGAPVDVMIGGDPQYLNSGAGTNNTVPGNTNSYTQRDFAGSVAHFAFFTNALTAAQVSNLYQVVGAPLVIMAQPAGPRVQAGGTPFLFFGVIASGSGPVSYQWYRTNSSGLLMLVDDNVKYVGSTTSQVTVSNLVDGDSGTYFVVISNNFGAVTSSMTGNPGLLTVDNEPAITAQSPAGGTLSLVAGQTPQTFTATAAAATNGLTYQWFTNGVAIPGATATSLPLPAVQVANSGTVLTFIASNAFGSATSSPVTVNVASLAAPTSAYASNILSLGPQGYWPMHEIEAPYPFQDIETNYGTLGSLGNAYFGDWQIIESGNPQYLQKQQAGALANDTDSSILFTGVNGTPSGGSYAIVPRTSPLTTLKPPLTLEAWVKPFNNPSFMVILSVGSIVANSGLNGGANEGGFDWLYSGGTPNCFSMTVRNGSGVGSTEPKTTASYPPGAWYHLVTTFDGTNVTYYINGVQDALINSSAATMNPNTWMPITIGGGRWSGSINNQWQGNIDELAVYTNILSVSDIQKHYNDGLTAASGVYKGDVLADKPLLYYRMDSLTYARPNTNNLAPLVNYGSGGVQGVYKPNALPGAGAGPTESGQPLQGFANTALTGDGNSIFADAGFDPSFSVPANSKVPLSVTAWFRLNPADVQQRNWQTLVGHTDQSWRCNVNGGSGAVGFDSGNGLDVRSTNTYNDGLWHQIVGTYDGANTLVYVDGKLQGSGNSATTNNISPFDIYLASSPNGQSNAAAGRTVAGSMCEAAFFNGKALTAQDVSNLYNAAGVPSFITAQPATSASVNANSCYTNTLVANGSGNLSYQWYNNGVAFGGQTNAALILCPVVPSNAGTNIYCVVSNSFGSVTSSILSLTVFSSPQFVVQPTNTTITNSITVFAGTQQSFKTVAVGAQPINYQWFTNSVLAPGATNLGYTVPAMSSGGSITVSCTASNFVGTSTTVPVLITTQPDPVAPYPVSVLALNPIAYWRLNEVDNGQGNGGVIANDYVGGISGDYTNASLGLAGYNATTDPTETSAQFGQVSLTNGYAGSVAGGINGTNVGLGNSNIVYGIDFAAPSNQSKAFSVSAWVNGGPQTAGAGILNKGFGGGGEQFNLDTGAANNAFRWFIRDASGATHLVGAKQAPDGNWHHLVGVCDEPNGTVALYVDGLLAASTAFNPGLGILASSNAMDIGARMSGVATSHDLQFVGTIDDVAVFNYALSGVQISNLYFSAGIAPSFAIDAPPSTNVNEHGTLVVSTEPVGTTPLTLQWMDVSTGTPLPGQTNATLTIVNYPLNKSGETYQLTVSNIYGTANSQQIIVNVQSGAPVFVQDLPTDPQSLGAGSPFTLSVLVSGTEPFTYTWHENGSVIPGANSNSYSGTVAFGQNQFYVTVANVDGGPITSQTATIIGTVGAPPVQLPATGSAGWTLDAQANGLPLLNNGILQLTDGGGSESRQAWFNTKQDVSRFLAEFTYQDLSGGTAGADGVTFCVQNIGTTAEGGGGGNLGVNGITPSVEFCLNIYHGTTPPGPAAGWNINGGVATTSTAPLVLDNGSHPIKVVIYYDGTTASAYMTDATGGTAAPVYTMNVNIPSLVGNPAFVGFTGADGGSAAIQAVSNFTFTTVSLPILKNQISGNNIVVSWPGTTSSLYTLQTASAASGPWTDVSGGALTVAGSQVQYSAPMAGTTTFYRLILRIP